MFDIGWSEMLVIGVVALIAIGPKELPAVLRSVGQWMGKIRRMASEFQGQFQEAMREAEMADLKKTVDDFADTARGFTSDPVKLPGMDTWETPSEPTKWTPPDNSIDTGVQNAVGEGTSPAASEPASAAPVSTEPGLDTPPAPHEGFALPKTEPGDIPLPAGMLDPPKLPEHPHGDAAQSDAAKSGATMSDATKSDATKSGSVPA